MMKQCIIIMLRLFQLITQHDFDFFLDFLLLFLGSEVFFFAPFRCLSLEMVNHNIAIAM